VAKPPDRKEPTVWLRRRLRLPRLLRELHGEEPQLYELLAVYLTGLAAAAVVLLLGGLADPAVRLWRRAVVALVALDVAGGVVACFTASTAAYYALRPVRRRLFIGLHVLEPGVLAAVFPAAALPLSLVGLYTLGAAYAVDALPTAESRRLAAAVLVVFGVTVFSVIGMPRPLLLWFAPAFMLKLVSGFAARR
jgi:hypothetical protein